MGSFMLWSKKVKLWIKKWLEKVNSRNRPKLSVHKVIFSDISTMRRVTSSVENHLTEASKIFVDLSTLPLKIDYIIRPKYESHHMIPWQKTVKLSKKDSSCTWRNDMTNHGWPDRTRDRLSRLDHGPAIHDDRLKISHDLQIDDPSPEA